jgi:hypothetical protein
MELGAEDEGIGVVATSASQRLLFKHMLSTSAFKAGGFP